MFLNILTYKFNMFSKNTFNLNLGIIKEDWQFIQFMYTRNHFLYSYNLNAEKAEWFLFYLWTVLGLFYKLQFSLQPDGHSCMPCPLAPDPIRVQSCVCCLFWSNRNSMAVRRLHLSFHLSHYLSIQSNESFNRRSQ